MIHLLPYLTIHFIFLKAVYNEIHAASFGARTRLDGRSVSPEPCLPPTSRPNQNY